MYLTVSHRIYTFNFKFTDGIKWSLSLIDFCFFSAFPRPRPSKDEVPSRLFHISKILDVPVQFFFEEAPHIGDGSPTRGMAEPDSEAFILEFLNSREGLELNRAFAQIKDPKLRRKIIDLVRTMASTAAG